MVLALDSLDSKKKKEKKPKPQPIPEDLDTFCLMEFDFSPLLLNDLFDSLEETHSIISHYFETTASYSSEMRKEIMHLSMEADLLMLDFENLFIDSAELTIDAKRIYQLGQPIKVPDEDIRDLKRRFKKAEKGLINLINKTRQYIIKVRDYKRYAPLPTM